MYSKVKLLRKRGQRLHERDIHAAPAAEGDLTMVYCGGTPELKLAAWDDSTAKPIIPVLYDAKLMTMHGNKMLFKGLERDAQGAEWAQEWSVLIGEKA